MTHSTVPAFVAAISVLLASCQSEKHRTVLAPSHCDSMEQTKAKADANDLVAIRLMRDFYIHCDQTIHGQHLYWAELAAKIGDAEDQKAFDLLRQINRQ